MTPEEETERAAYLTVLAMCAGRPLEPREAVYGLLEAATDRGVWRAEALEAIGRGLSRAQDRVKPKHPRRHSDRCGTKHRTYRTWARCHFRRPGWVHGGGHGGHVVMVQVAVLDHRTASDA